MALHTFFFTAPEALARPPVGLEFKDLPHTHGGDPFDEVRLRSRWQALRAGRCRRAWPAARLLTSSDSCRMRPALPPFTVGQEAAAAHEAACVRAMDCVWEGCEPRHRERVTLDRHVGCVFERYARLAGGLGGVLGWGSGDLGVSSGVGCTRSRPLCLQPGPSTLTCPGPALPPAARPTATPWSAATCAPCLRARLQVRGLGFMRALRCLGKQRERERGSSRGAAPKPLPAPPGHACHAHRPPPLQPGPATTRWLSTTTPLCAVTRCPWRTTPTGEGRQGAAAAAGATLLLLLLLLLLIDADADADAADADAAAGCSTSTSPSPASPRCAGWAALRPGSLPCKAARRQRSARALQRWGSTWCCHPPAHPPAHAPTHPPAHAPTPAAAPGGRRDGAGAARAEPRAGGLQAWVAAPPCF